MINMIKKIKNWHKLRMYRKLMKLHLGNTKQMDYEPEIISRWSKKFVDLYFKDVWK